MFENINLWWDGLDGILKLLYCIAIPATLLTVLQTILVLCGFGSDTDLNLSDTSGLDFIASDIDLNADMPSVQNSLSGIKFLTVQGFIIFFTIFSWTSIAFISGGVPVIGAVIIGICAGFGAMYGTAVLIRALKNLAHDGTVNFRNAIGENAVVYIPIPANDCGEGKVTLNLQGRFMEVSAVTTDIAEIKTGQNVRVTDIRGDTLVVETVNS